MPSRMRPLPPAAGRLDDCPAAGRAGHHGAASTQARQRTGPISLGLEFIPYIPVLIAVVVIAHTGVDRGPFIVTTGSLLLVCLLIRQVMIVVENVTLTSS